MSLDQFRTTLDVNLVGVFLYTREYMKHLRAYMNTTPEKEKTNFNASIILVGSTAGKFGEADHVDYACSKSALMYGFMKSLKNEIVRVVRSGRVNCVSPGWTRTPMAEPSLALGMHQKAMKTTPMAKVATTDDVSRAILFFSDPVCSGHVSGNVMMVHGGMEGRVLWQHDV
eukprot:TRINITY_DN5755_c0_g1_i4.p1 TRINITY_DN5755_c0_g1~~TRINITY_DN5755_c0_g1_i4.p1  ORF type:complete len:171 (+),score=17.92 TRINITY_DN5755_c0_g1_i4:437-949(+)